MDKNERFLAYKNLLFSIAYDMLGSVQDAEDILDEVYLKWTAVESNSISHPKAYLVKATTNMAINYLTSTRKKREQYSGIWLPEPVESDEQPQPDAPVEIYYSLSVGMLLLLEKLTAIERAVFLLREVFSYDYSEISEIITRSEDNCRQIFSRAKQHLNGEEKRFKVDLKAHEKMLNQFVEATYAGNIDALINLLKEDITLYADGQGEVVGPGGERLKALSQSLKGKQQVAKFIKGVTGKLLGLFPEAVFRVKILNGMPSLVIYIHDHPAIAILFEFSGDKATNIYAQGNPDKLKKIA